MQQRARENSEEEQLAKSKHKPNMDLIEEEDKEDKDKDDDDDDDKVESLLEPAMDKNVIDMEGNTPMHLASAQGHQDCLKYLILQAQCDYQIKNKYGYVAYDIAYNNEVRSTIIKLI